MLLFAKQKQHFFATVSLFEEGVREMLAVYFLFLNFPLPNPEGWKILDLVVLFNIVLFLLVTPVKHHSLTLSYSCKTSPLAPLRRGEILCCFLQSKNKLFSQQCPSSKRESGRCWRNIILLLLASPVKTSPLTPLRRGGLLCCFLQSKNNFLSQQCPSLKRESGRCWRILFLLHSEFSLPNPEGWENSMFGCSFQYCTPTLSYSCKTSPLTPLRRGELYVAFCKAKQLLLATVSLFEEGVREMLTVYDVNAYITIFTPNFVLSILYQRLFLKS